MAKARINGNVLRWARERAALPIEELAGRIRQDVARVAAWEAGEEHPTFRQAQVVAKIVHVPFGFLFLQTPPEEALPLPDLRTLGSAPAGQLDLNTRDLLRDVMFKHDWFVEVLEEQGHERLPFVGKFGVESDPKVVADDLRNTLGVANEAQTALNWEAHLRFLMLRAEDVGIWIMRSGIVGSNTHRPLDVRQFRGFALSHPVAPLVFINGSDAKAAQIFTIAHELAHIWIGSSGISNVQIGRTDYGTSRQAEVFCNKVAAEFLTPEDSFLAYWSTYDSFSTNCDRLARHFKVSKVVIARRAFDLGKIQEPVYSRFYGEQQAEWDREKNDTSSGGDFYLNLPIRNGRRFTYEVASRAVGGQTLFREAAALLNIKPALVPAVFKRATAR